MGYVYTITNTVNKRVYVGSSKRTPSQRLAVHRCRAKQMRDGKMTYGNEMYADMIEQNFTKFVLKTEATIDHEGGLEPLRKAELDLMNKLKRNGVHLYNILSPWSDVVQPKSKTKEAAKERYAGKAYFCGCGKPVSKLNKSHCQTDKHLKALLNPFATMSLTIFD